MSKNQDSNLYLNFKLFQTYYVKFCLAGGQRFEDYVCIPTGAEKSDKIYTQMS